MRSEGRKAHRKELKTRRCRIEVLIREKVRAHLSVPVHLQLEVLQAIEAFLEMLPVPDFARGTATIPRMTDAVQRAANHDSFDAFCRAHAGTTFKSTGWMRPY